jgi:hypothetical protein
MSLMTSAADTGISPSVTASDPLRLALAESVVAKSLDWVDACGSAGRVERCGGCHEAAERGNAECQPGGKQEHGFRDGFVKLAFEN